MGRKRDPFMKALASLRSRAEEGAFVPGRPVVIIEEARRLQLSHTPVREALGWLCGYGLVERGPTDGFVALRLDAASVRDRYSLRLHCLSLSLEGAAQGALSGQVASGERPVRTLAGCMLWKVRGTGNEALVGAYERVCSQLLQLSRAEERLFSDLEDEAEAIIHLFAGASVSGLRAALVDYHQRRMVAAPLLVLEAGADRPGLQPGVAS